MRASERRACTRATRWPCTAALAVLASLGAGTAAADPEPRRPRPIVVLLGERGPLASSAAAQHALSRLRRALDQIGADAPDAAALAARRDERVDASVLASAVSLRARAEQHFRLLESDAAIRLLEDASVLHTRRFADVFGDPEAARAARLAAALYRAEARPLRMKEELRRAITFAPDTPMDPALYPPDLVAEYDIQRDYLQASGLPLPSPTRLCEAARLVEAAAVATIAPLASTDASIGLDVYEPDTCARRAVAVPLTGDDEAIRRAAGAVLLASPPLAPPPVGVILRAGPAPLPPQPPAPTPWYGRWYTIAGLGAVVLGGVVTAAALSGGQDTIDAGTHGGPIGGGR